VAVAERAQQQGLTDAEVRERIARGAVNDSRERTSRTFVEIVRANVLTRFNAILGVMLAIIVVVGPLQDGLFGIVLVANALIGIVQELRAKRTLDKLAVLSAPKARVVREGSAREVAVGAVVLDDLLELRTGDQVPADGVVRVAVGLELDESLLTGESDSVEKAVGEEVLSGSFVVAGSGRFQATRVGPDAYARTLAAEARRFKLVSSELMDGINTILRYVTWAIIPTGLLLFASQLRHSSVPSALRGMVAGVVGMVPEGLVLLTSIAFGVAAVTLARRKVLVQELPAVEGLARVDVVCLDKTGTLTDGSVVLDRVEPFPGAGDVKAPLAALAADENANATLAAIGAGLASPPPGWSRTGAVPFSSARKWSAATFGEHGTWVLGAPEMVWASAGATDPVRGQADRLAETGRRVLLLARTGAPLDGDQLPSGLEAAAVVLLEEKVRPDAAETLRYFADQGVTLKVISGDNPRTVSAVAGRVELASVGQPFDARSLPDGVDALADVLESHSVFGRVTPQQKRAMVGALQSRGHTVAMTGDGVNDALALKDADIGIAMGSGAAATQAVAQLVLLDGRFATLPGVVAEGRRVMANIERVSNLFVTKTVYSLLLAVAVVFTGWAYPFLPRHLTLIGTLTIGVPAFFLSFTPTKQRYEPGFIRRVLRFAIPAGVVAATATFTVYGLARFEGGVTRTQAKTAAALVLLAIGLWVLVLLARPFNMWRMALVAAMGGTMAVVLAVPGLRDFYALRLPPTVLLVEAVVIATVAIGAIEMGWRASRRRQA
jgi:cation-transporting P-type ATPase E